MSGSTCERVALVTAERAQLPALDVLHRRGNGVEHYVHLAGEKIGKRRCVATIRHMDQVDAGHHLEQLAARWLRFPVPAEAMLILPGLALA